MENIKNEVGEFDLTTHIRHSKSGALIDTNHYKLRVHQGTQLFERPVGSGNLWYANGEPAGCWQKGEWKKSAEHDRSWKAPETKDDRLKKALIAADAKNKTLELELEAARRELKYGVTKETKQAVTKERGKA